MSSLVILALGEQNSPGWQNGVFVTHKPIKTRLTKVINRLLEAKKAYIHIEALEMLGLSCSHSPPNFKKINSNPNHRWW